MQLCFTEWLQLQHCASVLCSLFTAQISSSEAGEILTVTVGIPAQVQKLSTPPTVDCWKQPAGQPGMNELAPMTSWNCYKCICMEELPWLSGLSEEIFL